MLVGTENSRNSVPCSAQTDCSAAWPDVAICRPIGNFQNALAIYFSKNHLKLKLWCTCFGVLKINLFTVATNLVIFAKMLTTFLSEHLVTLLLRQKLSFEGKIDCTEEYFCPFLSHLNLESGRHSDTKKSKNQSTIFLECHKNVFFLLSKMCKVQILENNLREKNRTWLSTFFHQHGHWCLLLVNFSAFVFRETLGGEGGMEGIYLGLGSAVFLLTWTFLYECFFFRPIFENSCLYT